MAAKGFFEGFKKYLRETRAELRKVNWPNFKELVSYTSVVMVTVVFVALFIGVVDLVVVKLITPLLINR